MIVSDYKRSFVAAFCSDHKTVADIVTEADDKLFSLILHDKCHVLHSLLPDCADFKYNLRPRRHYLVQTAKGSSITDRNFITRMILKTFIDFAFIVCVFIVGHCSSYFDFILS